MATGRASRRRLGTRPRADRGGCAFGPRVLEKTHGRYNEAVRRVDEEQLLRNLVRMRYNETPLDLNVSSIAAQYELNGGAEARPFFAAPNPTRRRRLPHVHRRPARRHGRRREPPDHHPRPRRRRGRGPAVPHADLGRDRWSSSPRRAGRSPTVVAALGRADQRGAERPLGQRAAAVRRPRLRTVPAGGGAAPGRPATGSWPPSTTRTDFDGGRRPAARRRP